MMTVLKILAVIALIVVVVCVGIVALAVHILEKREKDREEMPDKVKQFEATLLTTDEKDIARLYELMRSGNTEEAERFASELFHMPNMSVKIATKSDVTDDDVKEFKRMDRRQDIEEGILKAGHAIVHTTRRITGRR